jgi:hypothetical protein
MSPASLVVTNRDANFKSKENIDKVFLADFCVACYKFFTFPISILHHHHHVPDHQKANLLDS